MRPIHLAFHAADSKQLAERLAFPAIEKAEESVSRWMNRTLPAPSPIRHVLVLFSFV